MLLLCVPLLSTSLPAAPHGNSYLNSFGRDEEATVSFLVKAEPYGEHSEYISLVWTQPTWAKEQLNEEVAFLGTPSFVVLLPVHPQKYLSAAFRFLSYGVTSSFYFFLQRPVPSYRRDLHLHPRSGDAGGPGGFQFPYQPSHKLWTIHRPTSQISYFSKDQGFGFPLSAKTLLPRTWAIAKDLPRWPPRHRGG